jgi:putative endonuclease
MGCEARAGHEKSFFIFIKHKTTNAMRPHIYYVYIVTNPSKTCLYVGVTNNLANRLHQHYENRGDDNSWAGKYYCYKLVHFEVFKYIDKAIAREKQIKSWRREKKNALINGNNPNWNFLNDQFPYNSRIEGV